MVRWAVTTAARWVPWNAVCLPQALAGQWMLRRRGLPSVMKVGLTKGDAGKHVAHAWLCSGDFLVTGDGDLARYAVLGEFHA